MNEDYSSSSSLEREECYINYNVTTVSQDTSLTVHLQAWGQEMNVKVIILSLDLAGGVQARQVVGGGQPRHSELKS